jgi:hypothetical protein
MIDHLSVAAGQTHVDDIRRQPLVLDVTLPPI